MEECLLVGYIVHNNAAVRPAIECRAKRLESFLTGSIPYLKNDSPIFCFDFFVGEIRANGRLEVVSKAVMLEHLNKRCLAHVGVSNYDDFDEVFADVAVLGLGKESSRRELSLLRYWLVSLHLNLLI